MAFLWLKWQSRVAAAVLMVALQPAAAFGADAASTWNVFALDRIAAAPVDSQQGERALAMMHIAIYEAANAAHPVYVRSALAVPDSPGASVEAAIAEAGYRTIVAVLPAFSVQAELVHAEQLAKIPASAAKERGIATGAAAAAAVLLSREGDGNNFSHDFAPGTGDGAYVLTSDGLASGPHAAQMRPFLFASYAAFRPPPPPALDSSQMRRDLEETRVLGSEHSMMRTAEQTEIGVFHRQAGFYSWSSLARQAIEHNKLGPVESAHLLAAVETVIVDSHLAVGDAKYAYNRWRPATAIHAGGGPLHLTPDPGWASLIPSPLHPEYPCAHCSVGAAAQMVLEALAGTGPFDFAIQNGTVTRHYHSFRQYAEEESASRIYAGVHLRWSLIVGDALGREIGAYEAEKISKPLKPMSVRPRPWIGAR